MATNVKNAAEVCGERMKDIAALLDQIGQEISGVQKEYREGDGLDWGMAGTLGKVREDLIESLRFLSSLSKQEIEATLEELRGRTDAVRNS